MAAEAVEASEVAEAFEVNEAAEVFKAWKITMKYFKAILVLEFNILRTKIISFRCFEKKKKLAELWKPMMNFLAEAVEACLC